jgi:hypothetical protein
LTSPPALPDTLALPDAEVDSAVVCSDTATDPLAEAEPRPDADAPPDGHSVAPMLRTEAPSSDPQPASTNAAAQMTMSLNRSCIRVTWSLLTWCRPIDGDALRLG